MKRLFQFLLFSACALASITSSRAAIYDWDGAIPYYWDVVGNWAPPPGGGGPGAGDDAVFPAALPASKSVLILNGANRSINSLSFAMNSTDFLVGGQGGFGSLTPQLNVGTHINQDSGQHVAINPDVICGTPFTLGGTGGGAVDFNGSFLGSPDLIVNGPGAHRFRIGASTTGLGLNSIDLNGSTLEIGMSNTVNVVGNVVIDFGATLRLCTPSFSTASFNAAQVIVGGTLFGNTTVNAAVTVTSGAIISAGCSPGTLTIGGNLTFDPTSVLNYELDAPGVVGGGVNDLIVVDGNLSLAGIVNVTPLAGFGLGTYRLFNYTGALSGPGLTLGSLPSGYNYAISTVTAGQVNLVVTPAVAGLVLFNNRIPPTVVAPIYGPSPSDPTLALCGNATTNGGSVNYTGHTLLSGTGYTCQLWGGPLGTPDAGLVPLAAAPFRVAPSAGFIVAPPAVAVAGVPPGALATVQVRAWDNMNGSISNWAGALASTNVARGACASFTVGPLGTNAASATRMTNMLSFNIHLPPAPFSYTIAIHTGFNLIANHLNHGSNTLGEIMPDAPVGCVFYQYNSALGTWSASTLRLGGWDPDPNFLALHPGQGAYLQSPTNFTLTMTGTARTPVLPVLLEPGRWQLLSRQTIGTGTYEDIVGNAPAPGTTVAQLTGGSFQIAVFDPDLGGWDPFAPLARVGESMWFNVGGGMPPQIELPPPVRLFLNEWLADAIDDCCDPIDGQHDDWFEIYNPGTNAVDLRGCYLTDWNSNDFKFLIPSGHSVPAGGFLRVFADNQPEQNSTNSANLHVNFTLANGGGSIGLYAPDGTAIDAITFGPQTPDVSEGRWPDGGTNVYAMAPTPAAANAVIPRIITQPANQTVPAGQAATFGLLAGGAAPLSYRWFIVAPPAEPPALVAGATSSVHTISNTQPANAGSYFVVVSNAFGVATSAVAVLNVGPALAPCCSGSCPNLVVNGSFEQTSPSMTPNLNHFFGPPSDPAGTVAGWSTTPMSGRQEIEIWCNNAGIPAAAGTNHLEVNAQLPDQTVFQVIAVTPGYPVTLCFKYTGRFGVVGGSYNNDFQLILSGGYNSTTSLNPPTYSVAAWQLYTTTFVPSGTSVTIAFRGRPHYNDGTGATQGGAHIDSVCATQVTPPPTLVCAPDKIVECGSNWFFDAPVATGSGLILSMQQPSVVGTPCARTNTAVFVATDWCGRTVTCTQTVVVVDTTPPVILCTEFGVPCGTPFTFTPPFAYDPGCSNAVTVTPGSTRTNGTCPVFVEREWVATDACGNSAVCTQHVAIVDFTPPVFTTHCTTNHYEAGGVTDNFSGPEPTSPSAGLVARLQSMGAVFKGFDNCTTERFLAHTFTDLPPCITAATVTVRLKTCGTILCGNDTLGFSFTDPSGQLASGSGSWSQTLGALVAGDWCLYTSGRTFVFDLAALPTGGGATDLIASMNQNGFLDFVCQDDSAVDYISLDVISCCCGTNRTVECGMDWTFETPTATDNCCTNVTITALSTVTNFISTCRQTITRTWQAMDCCSNSAICLEVIKVVDTTPPVFDWGSPAVNLVPNGSFETGVPAFNLANQLFALSVNSPNVSGWTIVQNGSAPLYWANGSHPASLGTTYGPAADGNLYLYFNGSFDNSTPRGKITTLVNFPAAGSYRLEYDMWSESSINGGRDAGFTAELAGVASYTDHFTPPFSPNGTYPTVTAPHWQHIVHDFTVTAPGSHVLSFTDASIYGNPSLPNAGNTPSPFLDHVSITANCCGAITTVECNAPWNTRPPTAFDTCCGTNVTLTSIVSGSGNLCSNVNTIVWIATDCCSNSITCTQTVIIVDTTAPDVTCPANKTVECGTAWTFDRPTAYDACCGTNLTITPILPPVSVPGTCPVTRIITQSWEVTDCCGNRTTCSQTVTVVDTTRPLLHCPEIIKVPTCSNGVPVYYHVVATDNCDASVQVVCTPPAPGPFPLGTTIIQCTATDDCGNTTTCSFPIVVYSAPNFWQAFPAGLRDCYANKFEPASPGLCLQSAYPGACWKWFDDPKINCFLGHSWNLPFGTYLDGTLTLRMKDYRCLGSANDTISLGLLSCNPGPSWAWSRPLANLGADLGQASTSPWCNIPDWGRQFVLNLDTLPPAGGASSVLGNINAPAGAPPWARRLDLLVQDDTRVDFAWLRLLRCPPQHIVGGFETRLTNAHLVHGPGTWTLAKDAASTNGFAATFDLGAATRAQLNFENLRFNDGNGGTERSIHIGNNNPDECPMCPQYVLDWNSNDFVRLRIAQPIPGVSNVIVRTFSNGVVVVSNTLPASAGAELASFASTAEVRSIRVGKDGGMTGLLAEDEAWPVVITVTPQQAITPDFADVQIAGLTLAAKGFEQITLLQPEVGVASIVDPADGQHDDWFAAVSGDAIARAENGQLTLSALDANNPGRMGLNARFADWWNSNDFRAVLHTALPQFSPVPSNASVRVACIVDPADGQWDDWGVALNFCTEQDFFWALTATRTNAPLPLRRVSIWNSNDVQVANVPNPASLSVSEVPHVYWPSTTWFVDDDICHRFLWNSPVTVRIDGTSYQATELRFLTDGPANNQRPFRGLRVETTGAEALVLSDLELGPIPYKLDPPVVDGGDIVIRGNPLGGVIESAPTVRGPWSTVLMQDGEVRVSISNAPAKFFRVKGN